MEGGKKDGGREEGWREERRMKEGKRDGGRKEGVGEGGESGGDGRREWCPHCHPLISCCHCPVLDLYCCWVVIVVPGVNELGNIMGNPGFFKGYLYPYPAKTVPQGKGIVLDGLG